MAIVNLSAYHENNLRKTSEVGVATFTNVVSEGGDRLGQTVEYALAADDYIVYNIPADSIVTKFYFIVDEAFDALTTCRVSTIVDNTTLVAALNVATVGASVSTVVDTYFDAVDGIKFELSANATATGGKLRVVAEYISGSQNNGSYVDLGA